MLGVNVEMKVLTSLAVWISVSRSTHTGIRVNAMSTCCTVLTRVWWTFVDIWEKCNKMNHSKPLVFLIMIRVFQLPKIVKLNRTLKRPRCGIHPPPPPPHYISPDDFAELFSRPELSRFFLSNLAQLVTLLSWKSGAPLRS